MLFAVIVVKRSVCLAERFLLFFLQNFYCAVNEGAKNLGFAFFAFYRKLAALTAIHKAGSATAGRAFASVNNSNLNCDTGRLECCSKSAHFYPLCAT